MGWCAATSECEHFLCGLRFKQYRPILEGHLRRWHPLFAWKVDVGPFRASPIGVAIYRWRLLAELERGMRGGRWPRSCM